MVLTQHGVGGPSFLNPISRFHNNMYLLKIWLVKSFFSPWKNLTFETLNNRTPLTPSRLLKPPLGWSLLWRGSLVSSPIPSSVGQTYCTCFNLQVFFNAQGCRIFHKKNWLSTPIPRPQFKCQSNFLNRIR